MPRYRSNGGLDDPRVEDGDIGFRGINLRQPSWQLPEGMLTLSENGRIDGDWRPRKGCEVVSAGLAADGAPLRLPFWLIDAAAGALISTAVRTGSLVTLTFMAHGIPITGEAYLIVEGIDFVSVDPNGGRLVTVVDATTMTYTIPGAVGNEVYTILGTDEFVLSKLDDTAVDEALASCLFSDPNSANAESIFIAFGTSAKVLNLATGVITTLDYPVGETLDDDVSMIQALDKVLIFRGGDAALQWESGDTAFSLVPSGAYTQPQVFSVTGANVAVVSGLCTLTVAGNVTINAGDLVRIYGTTHASFEPFIGEQYLVTAATATTIEFFIPVEDLATIGADTLSVGRQVSVGGGFIHQPGFPWAVYFQRRLWGPYLYGPGPSFTARGVTDEIIASDILDSDTYDALQNQFRITGGTADHVVGMHPFFEDALLVFNRNSIHGVFGTVGSLLDASVRELTREVGCLARRSIVTQGNSIFFLSDSGVYMLQFVDQYNLRGTERPLSQAIQPYIDRISWNLAPNAVGIYHNNRYWLAVPLDSSPRQGDATGNNALLVFNLLNGEWESVDTFGIQGFDIRNLIIGTSESRNDLYAVGPSGGVHRLDSLDEGYDMIATATVSEGTQTAIAASMQTRSYMCGTDDRKRFAEAGLRLKAGSAQCDASIGFATEDPDSVEGTTLVSTLLGEYLSPDDTADVRARVGGVRGFNGSIRVSRVIGRPQVRGTKVSATVTNRSVISHQ